MTKYVIYFLKFDFTIIKKLGEFKPKGKFPPNKDYWWTFTEMPPTLRYWQWFFSILYREGLRIRCC
jgi:hypothetical protein